MIDPRDPGTQQLQLEQKRSRGRPATGQALSNAERQRAYRERQKAQRNDNSGSEESQALDRLAIEHTEFVKRKQKEVDQLKAQIRDLEKRLEQRNGKEIFERHKQDMREAGNTPITPYRLGLQVGKTGIGLDLEPPYETAKSKNSYKSGIRIGRETKAAK